MRDAFGVQKNVRLPGITEFEGLPTRAKLKNSVHIAPEDSSATPTPNEGGSSFVTDKAFNLAAASLRQALQGKWGLSTDRANAVRQILEGEGYPSANFYKVAGKTDTDPLFPEDSSMAPNRRVTITLVREASPVPPNLQP
jgi:hypothetical protein